MQLHLELDEIATNDGTRPRDIRHRLMLVVETEMPSEHVYDTQLSFDLQKPAQKVIHFQSRQQSIYFDYHIYDLLGCVPNARIATRCLRKYGILLVGDIVQCSRYSISQIIPKIPGLLENLEEELAIYGLKFGMDIKSWHRPHSLFRLEA